MSKREKGVGRQTVRASQTKTDREADKQTDRQRHTKRLTDVLINRHARQVKL